MIFEKVLAKLRKGYYISRDIGNYPFVFGYLRIENNLNDDYTLDTTKIVCMTLVNGELMHYINPSFSVADINCDKWIAHKNINDFKNIK